MDNKTVKEFYDMRFIKKMLGYRIEKDSRILKAIGLAKKYIKINSRVLDVGCGIGIVSEAVARVCKKGYVVGVDISNENIRFANTTVKKRKVKFLCASADELAKELILKLLGGPPDCILLIDVIEHIEKPGELLNRLCGSLANDGYLVVTYPSVEFQQYLKKNFPENIQPVDREIYLKDLAFLLESLGMTLVHYQRVNIWRTGDYIHCVFSKGTPCEIITPNWKSRLLALCGTPWRRLLALYYRGLFARFSEKSRQNAK